MTVLRSCIFRLAVTAAVMIALPWLTAVFVKDDAGMAVCFLLLFFVNPLYAVIAGVSAGKQVKSLWWQPAVIAALFLCGAWLFFDRNETVFTLYAAGYFIAGLVSMLLAVFIKRK